ncbi:phage tail protein [Haemophilus sp. Marseille-Q0026]|uniref:phage tail protein n=2 Tax=Haemophilus TaxID=724 RepID=UPI001CF90315|nr:phage tail protein [Haemophilus sp. Marseille-Q0026]
MGKGGGGGGHTPVEAKETGRSKQFVKIVEVISEGEIEGLADGMKSVYLDNTPIQNNDDSYNFQNVLLEGRIGSQVQDIIPGFNTSEKEISVSTQVRKTTPITRTITDNKVSRLRLTLGVQSLFNQEDNGDTNGTSVSLVVYIGNASYPITISGKYSSQYLQQHTFTDLPSTPFTLRVERLTDDSKSQRLQNNTVWASYTEIIDTEFTYPNTALIGVKFDSEYFLNIPNRTYDIKGLKIKVPSNYNPETRQYTGFWDGTFKIEWSDNPAWVLYDVVTNKRYGLGQRLGEFGADKWALYQVAQYCDQLVPDGFGGQEPRFTCNVWLTEQRSAYQVINDICSIFRAMPVWNGQQLTVVMDRPADPVWTYTNANVDESGFSYTFSARKSRHNAIQVEYADKENSYEKAIEYVADDESIRKNGLNVKKITAFGCTSRGQAHRTALWLLQTEKLETKTVTFTVGAEGLMHIPGDIIKVADTHYAGTNIGGRVLAVNGKTVTLDREITISGNSYLSYINANTKHQNIKIISVNGAEVTLDQQPLGLELYGVWSLATQQVTSQLFKALSVKEESKGKYTIMALQHEPQKEAIVDNGAKFEPVGTTVLTTPQISNIGVAVNADGSVSVDSRVTGGNGIVKYDIRIYKGGVLYDVRLGQPSPSLNIDGLENGDYSVLVQVKNENGQLLSEKTQTFTINKPPAPTGVRATGGLGNITLEWDWVDDVTATEIFTSETDDIKTAKRLTKLTAKMYSHEVGAKQVRYYWLRHVRGQNVGAFHQQAGIRGESSVDIDKELKLLNEKLSQNIINEVFDTAAPARKLEMVKTVANLNVNQFQGVKQVYNERDGKLYLWNGSQYTSKIQASEIAGQLNQNQLDNELITQLNTAKDSATQAVAQSQEAKRKVAELSSEFNNINFDVGARNYLLRSAEGGSSWGVSSEAKENWRGKKLTLSLYLNAKGIVRGGRNRVGLSMFLYYMDNSYTWIECWLSNHQGDYSGRLKSTIQLLDKPIKSISNCSFKVEVGGGTCVATHPKLEIGNVATDWSPAPEDLTTVIQFEDIKRTLTNESNARVAWENSANSRIGNAEATINQLGGTKTNKDEVATIAAQALRSQWQSDAKAKVDEVSRAISSETKARTDWQRSAESKINRVDGFSARIDEINRTVTDVSGKVSATRTIKTQAIAGGRTAIAGIALGAANSGKDVESSVIVMADKFQVVKNAQDGSPKSMLSVVNDQIAINGDLIANGQITAAKLAAGAVRADHFAAGEISADKLAIGLGGNLLQNPIFATAGKDNTGGDLPHGWSYWVGDSSTFNGSDGGFLYRKAGGTDGWSLLGGLDNENTASFTRQINNTRNVDERIGWFNQDVRVIAGQTYMASCYLAVHSGKVKISIEELAKDSSAYISWIGGTDWVTESQANASNRDFSKYRRVWFKFTAPNTGHIRFAIQMNSINGGVNPWAFVLRPMLEECTQYATQPSPWQNAGVTSIHGGSIVTHSITAQQIAAGTITGNEIVGGTIAGKHIASKTINTDHIASKSITAEELSVESLSAISADLGAITGGSLKIGSLNGNFGTLFEVQSNGGFRLISRDASGGIELSSATRALHVWDGGTEVVRVGKLS